MAFNKPKSLSKILSVFETVKADLKEYVAHQQSEIDWKNQQRTQLSDEIIHHSMSMERANQVLNNIDALTVTEPTSI